MFTIFNLNAPVLRLHYLQLSPSTFLSLQSYQGKYYHQKCIRNGVVPDALLYILSTINTSNKVLFHKLLPINLTHHCIQTNKYR